MCNHQPRFDDEVPCDGLGYQLEHIERAAIVRALEQTRYNKTAAAQAPWNHLPGAALPRQEARHRVRLTRHVTCCRNGSQSVGAGIRLSQISPIRINKLEE
jgi:hypothetical protein